MNQCTLPENNTMKIKEQKNYMPLILSKKIRKQKNRKFKDIDEKITFYLDPRKTKMAVEFNDRESASIKSFAVKNKKAMK